MTQIYCLQVDGGSISDQENTALFILTQLMMKERKRRVRLKKKKHGVDGEITTEFTPTLFGSLSGFLFNASFETETRTIKVVFISKQLRHNAYFKNVSFPRERLDDFRVPARN